MTPFLKYKIYVLFYNQMYIFIDIKEREERELGEEEELSYEILINVNNFNII